VRVTTQGVFSVDEQQKRAAFDAVVAKLQAAKAKVETIKFALSKRTSLWAMERLHEAQADLKKLTQGFDEDCDKIENDIKRRKVA
jgi:hypothetical protein